MAQATLFSGFNLVIENLLILTTVGRISDVWRHSLFQSRNRESSDFNSPLKTPGTYLAIQVSIS